jgi:hypothetical protein
MRSLLSELEDPFQMFPLMELAGKFTQATADYEQLQGMKAGPYGVSAKFKTVEDEHLEAVISLLIGSVFVLAQTAITQSVSIVIAIRRAAGNPSWLPAKRIEIMKLEAPIHKHTGLSELILFDSIANYFKHHHEWPDDWSSSGSGTQAKTIETVATLGLSAGNSGNLECALRELGYETRELDRIGENIQAWRERLAANLRKRLTDGKLL